ncbi:MAG TPA: ABC transporter substrate-binding protein [Candidatus Paceibacterota bacterium]
MKNKLIFLGVAIAIVCVGVFVNRDSSHEVIKIGVVAPLTGPGSAFGNSLVKAIELAQRDLGGTKYRYEVVIEDDATNPATSASAAQKMIQIDGVKAIISATSGSGNAIAPIAEASKVPLICIACADKRIGTGKYSYTSSVQVEDEAKVFVDHAVKNGAKTVGVLSQNHPGINAVADAVKAEAISRNIPVVYEERFDGNNRDFKTIIKKAAAANADIYFLQAFPPALDIVGKELAALGVKNVAGGAGAFTIAAEPTLFEGKWYTEALADADFTERFSKEFPDVRFNIRTGPYGYDAFNMLVQGLDKDADMAAYLAGIDTFDGKVGQYKTDGNWFRSTPGVWMVKDGKFVVISQD